MNTQPQQLSHDPHASAVILTAFSSFIRWASVYGHELKGGALGELDGIATGTAMALSSNLSASVNFGYNPEDQSIYVVLDQEEFDWLPDLPVAEVLVGRERLYVLTREVVVDDLAIESMAIAIEVGQPKLWQAFPDAVTIGFLCLRHSEYGYEVIEESQQRYKLRYLNS